MAKKVKKRKRLNIKRTLVFVLFLYIVGYSISCLVNRPIRHIEITGNILVNDSEILRISKLKDYPSIIKYTSNTIEKRIESIDLIDSVDVKKWFGNIVKINIKENKILFYYQNTNKIALSNGNIINNEYKNIYGIPLFINSVKSDIMNDFIKNFSKVEDNIISEINEIEYYPKYNENNEIISEDRFKILMNDGNTIIANVKTVSVINKYNTIYASLGDRKGTINLDSNKISNLVFIPYEE